MRGFVRVVGVARGWMAGTTSSSLSAVGTRSVVAARVGGPRWLGSGAVANSLWRPDVQSRSSGVASAGGVLVGPFRLRCASSSGGEAVEAATATNSASTDSDLGIKIGEGCVKRLQAINRKHKEAGEPEKILHLMVDSGGCSGFAYKFTLVDEGKLDKGDRVFEKDGVRVAVDELSLSFVRGSTIDYTTELIKRAFVVANNPNAEAGCGCGISFSLK